MKKLTMIGACSGIGASDSGCKDGPIVFKKTKEWQALRNKGLACQWLDFIYSNDELNKKNQRIADWCYRLATAVSEQIKLGQHFAVIGGDHSCAIGTWSGACKVLANDLGLIWIDAHLDSHTPETTSTSNIHGMPVAVLLGYGDSVLTDIETKGRKVNPENLCIIGVRSFEPEEFQLINKLNVRVYFMEEILARGLDVVLAEAKQMMHERVKHYGISIDLDAITPEQAPGVGTPVLNGLDSVELCDALKIFSQDLQLVGLEIAEFNPHKDVHCQTADIITKLIQATWVGY